MKITVNDPMEDLFRAACGGDVETLKQLFQQDATLLGKIPDRETPLHISALLGHVSFTEVLLSHNHDLAIRADSSQRTALHLASTSEDNLETVKKLLQFNSEPCLVRDEEGRIPLHYAAIRGRTEVVKELIKAKPESLSYLLNGKTVFHLCIIYNHLETLRALVELDYATANITKRTNRSPIFMLHDHAENTILHLAIKFKRIKTIRYLLSIPEIRKSENKRNKEGLTANDILECSPNDYKIDEIKLMLGNVDKEEPGTSMLRYIWNCFKGLLKWIGNQLKHGGSSNWLEEMRGNLSAASIFIATVTFQALINPPQDFVQLDSSSSSSSSLSQGNNNSPSPSPQHKLEESSFGFYVQNISLSFYASLYVTLLLVSGIPLKNSATISMLCIGLSLTLLFLAFAYSSAARIIVRKRLSTSSSFLFHSDTFSYIRNLLLCLIAGFYTLRFIIWITNRCYEIIKKLSSCCCG